MRRKAPTDNTIVPISNTKSSLSGGTKYIKIKDMTELHLAGYIADCCIKTINELNK